jgi:hypothetical protein
MTDVETQNDPRPFSGTRFARHSFPSRLQPAFSGPSGANGTLVVVSTTYDKKESVMEADRSTDRTVSGAGTPRQIPIRHRRARAIGVISSAALVFGIAGSGIAGAATKSTVKSHDASSAARPGPGGPGGPGIGGGPRGVVSAIGTDTITITGMDGTSVTFDTTSATTYTKDGASSTSAALAVGENVSIQLTAPPTSSTATSTAKSINIVSPSLRGSVVSVSGTTIVVQDGQGFYRTIDTSASTTFLNGGAASTIASITPGENVLAVGSVDADHTDLDAATVGVLLPRVMGEVKSVSGSTFTLTEPGGTTVTVTETGSTAYESSTMTSATSAVVVVGAHLSVEGTKDSSGNITATSIDVAPTSPNGGPGAGGPSSSGSGRGGPGGPGGGGPGGPGGGPGGGF